MTISSFFSILSIYGLSSPETFSHADLVNAKNFLYQIEIFALNFMSYLYIFIKFYKVLCYSKMTFEWLPMINPYIWPFSFFQTITGPYFRFWSKVIPSVKAQKSSMDISGIVALEALSAVLYFCVRGVNQLIVWLLELENQLAIFKSVS